MVVLFGEKTLSYLNEKFVAREKFLAGMIEMVCNLKKGALKASKVFSKKLHVSNRPKGGFYDVSA